MMNNSSFMTRAIQILELIKDRESQTIEDAARLLAKARRDGRDVWVFGTGHSHMIAEEFFGRAGGFSNIRAVWESGLMLHEGELKSSMLERLPGLADVLIATHPIAEGDLVFVASNSGINAVAVEFAQRARALGATVVAITSRAHSASQPARTLDGAKLMEVVDLVIDNHGVPGDAVVPLVDGGAVAATSTMAGAFIVESVVSCAALLLEQWGIKPDILISNNIVQPRESCRQG